MKALYLERISRRATVIARSVLLALVALCVIATLAPPVAQAGPYRLQNFLVLVDDQLIMKGPAQVLSYSPDPMFPFRSDLGSRNLIDLGARSNTFVPEEAPTITDVAVIAPNVKIGKFGKVSNVIYNAVGGSYTNLSTVTPTLVETSLANNSINTTSDPLLPDFPPFPVFVPGAVDQVVPSNGSLDIAPGNYRDLIIGPYGVANFTSGGKYTFRRIIANAKTGYQLIMPNDTQIQVKQFVRLAEYGRFNPGLSLNVTLYIEGEDGTYDGTNKNGPGVVRSGTALPAAFEYGGDGVFYACFVFVPNGTINVRGHLTYIAQWFGDSFQQIATLSIKLQRPPEDCLPLLASCSCITDFELLSDGKLQVEGIGFDSTSVKSLAFFIPSTTINVNDPASGAFLLIPRADLTILDPATLVTKAALSPTTLPPGQYTLGIIYPIDGLTGNSLGYCVNTDKTLTIP